MFFAHHICCCFFVPNIVNYFIKQNSQLDKFLETLQILTSLLLIEVTVDGVIELKSVKELCI